MYLQNQNVLVAGLGSTGLSVLHYCAKVGAKVDAYDAAINDELKQRIQQQWQNVQLFSGSLKEALQDKDVLVLSPGISKRQPEIEAFEQAGGQVIGDVAAWIPLSQAILAPLFYKRGWKEMANLLMFGY